MPPWVAPAVMLCAVVPAALSQQQQGGAPAATTGPAGATAAEVDAQVVKTPERTLLEWFFDGGVFMYPIALCSVLAVAIIIERLLTLQRGRVAPAGFLPGLKSTMRDLNRDREREAGLAYARPQDHALARVIAAGIKRAPRGVEAMERAMEDQGGSEAVKLRRNMRFLYAIASVSTLLGLIGTIQGMIQAFQAAEVVGTGKFGPLAKGIYVALITTFAGLLVAIPVTVAYYFLAGRIERLVSVLNDEAGDFVDHYAGGPASSAAADEVPDAPLSLDVGTAAEPRLPAGPLAPQAWPSRP